ncbi:MAG: BAX inhibitor (BI)-1/YccA family protein, partial [Desulfovibrio sp.]
MSNTRSVAQNGVNSVASIYMRQVYQWMTVGLGVTTLVAWFVASTPAVQQVIFGNSLIMIGLIVAQFGLV